MNAQSASTTQSQHLVPRVAEADSRLSRNYPGLLASLGFAAFLLVSAPALAATAPPLGTLQQFAILASSTVTAAGIATITNGDVGVSPGTSITGTINLAPGFAKRTPLTSPADAALLTSAQLAATNASTNLLLQGPGTTILAELGGTTKTPGVYSFASTANIANNTTFTLDAQGQPQCGLGFPGGERDHRQHRLERRLPEWRRQPLQRVLAGRQRRDSQWPQLPGNCHRGRGTARGASPWGAARTCSAEPCRSRLR